MSSWNRLLEALHSALIDELVDRVRGEKPVLGLPKKVNGFSLPSDMTSGFLVSEVVLEGAGRGVALIAIEPGLSNGGGLGADAEDRLWAAITKRAEPEIIRRGISPVFGAPRFGNVSLPVGLSVPRATLWIPFGLKRGQVFLGLGVA